MEEAEVVEDFWLLGGVSQNDGGNREVGRAAGCPRIFPEKNLFVGEVEIMLWHYKLD